MTASSDDMVHIPATHSRIVLLRRPTGPIDTSLAGNGTFGWEKDVPVQKDLGADEVLVAVEYLSLDPAMRGWLNDTRSYIPPVGINEVMRSAGVGRIAAVGREVDSNKYKIGSWVSATVGWQEFAKMKAKEVIPISVSANTSPSYYLGALGMPGQTAYWGLLDVGKIQAGDIVVVSGAAGAVGSVACQIAKAKGCKVIAIAGGADKCQWLKDEVGVDVALDYKSKTFKQDFKAVGYIDVYFDNVGGEILDLVLTRLKKGARIALCGAISAYNDPNPKGLQMYLNLISQRAKIEGFIVFDYASKYHVAEADISNWINSGKMKIRETQLVGLEKCPEGLQGLFAGANTGKMVVKVGGAGTKL
ncbi:zinc-binding alcohol dehydrogenase [Pseudohyphozyma bogoriensis]|nr:zinc-binding alcohol dehydrogenase [Pseudohyphozyma bogoriensis]